MKEKMFVEPKKELPIIRECDVVVIGGGTAGVVAALASARTGADTLLVEQYGFLGGNIHAGVCSWHNFFNNARIHDVKSEQVVKGIPEEMIARLKERGGSPGHVLIEEPNIACDYNTIVDREKYKQLAFDMMKEDGVTLMLHTYFSDCIMENNKLKGIIVESKQGRGVILAKRFIDTTGDGDVAARAGCELKKDLEPYPVGKVYAMANVDLEKFVDYLKENDCLDMVSYTKDEDGNKKVARILWYLKVHEKYKEFAKKTGIHFISAFSVHDKEITYLNGSNADPLEDLSHQELTKAEVDTRKIIMDAGKILQENIPGFEDAYISWTSHQAGIRRSRVIECEYDITDDDIDNARRFDDEIGLYGYHDMPQAHRITNGGWYGIPYRALIPLNVDNLLVAGRMITSSKTAHMSTRNSVSCMIQGQAAGVASALSMKHETTPRKLNVKSLQKKLRQQNVMLDL